MESRRCYIDTETIRDILRYLPVLQAFNKASTISEAAEMTGCSRQCVSKAVKFFIELKLLERNGHNSGTKIELTVKGRLVLEAALDSYRYFSPSPIEGGVSNNECCDLSESEGKELYTTIADGSGKDTE